MKIEQLIVQYLYTNKKVSLQEIGVFHLSPNVTISPENDNASMPDNAIIFDYNTKATQDDKLIDFIVQQTRKIKPLATSDLESFTILGRQFMNIGKPLLIEGLGTLQKNQLGEYEFIQGHSINPRLEPLPALLKEKHKEEIVFTTPGRPRNNKTGIIAAVVIFFLLAALAAFYFLYKNKDSKADQPVAQSTVAVLPIKDTSLQTSTTLQTTGAVTPVSNEYTFKVVINEYAGRAAANKAFTTFSRNGRTLLVYSKDSSIYKLAIPFMLPLTDTLQVKDSLQRLFGRMIYVETD